MPFRNLTPLPCMTLNARTPAGEEREVVIVRATLDLVPCGADLRAGGFTHFLKLAQEQLPLLCADVPHGTPGKTSLRWESDLAPVKPRCDVIVLGEAHAPGGRPRRRFQAGLRLRAPDRERPLPGPPQPLSPWMEVEEDVDSRWQGLAAWARAHPVPGEVLLDKRLRVTGPRWLKRRNLLSRAVRWAARAVSFGLVRPCPWKLTAPVPVASVPLRYEFSFGGHVQLRPGEPGFRRVPRRHWRKGADPTAREGEGVLAEAWWEPNPVGRGYAPAWLIKAARIKRLPAPQIEDPRRPFTAKAALAASRSRAPGTGPLGLQGMGVVTRRWASRLQYAGTWHEGWNESGAPYLPGFQDAFWNVAHPDLQCRHLEGEETLELTNLCPPGTPEMHRDAKGDSVLRCALPGLCPYLLMRFESGELAYVPAVLDTLVVEPGEARVTLVYRASFPGAPQPEGVELGLAMPGAAEAPEDPDGAAVPPLEAEPAHAR